MSVTSLTYCAVVVAQYRNAAKIGKYDVIPDGSALWHCLKVTAIWTAAVTVALPELLLVGTGGGAGEASFVDDVTHAYALVRHWWWLMFGVVVPAVVAFVFVILIKGEVTWPRCCPL